MKNKSLFTIFLIVFIDLLGFGLILPLLPYIAEKYGANPFQIGLLTATYSFFQLVSSPILGRLSDRYGRKKMLIISQMGSALGYLILALGNNMPLLFLSRIIDGATGGNISIAQAYIADVTTKENRAKGMGLIGAAFGLGFIFGPAAGGLLAKFGFSYPAFFAFGVSLITVMTTAFTLRESVNTRDAQKKEKTGFSFQELKRVLGIHPIGLLIIVFFFLNFAFSLFQGNFALWTQKLFNFGPTQNGFLFTLVGVVVVVTQMVILPFLLKRSNEKSLLKWGYVLLGAGFFFLTFAIHPYLIYLALPFISFGNGLSMPTLQSVASENVPRDEYGGTLGLLQSSGSLGRIVGPAVGGLLFEMFRPSTPFIVAGIMVFALVYLLHRKLA